jgi:hypothetical protein
VIADDDKLMLREVKELAHSYRAGKWLNLKLAYLNTLS